MAVFRYKVLSTSIFGLLIFILVSFCLHRPVQLGPKDKSPRKILNFNTNWAFRSGDIPEAYAVKFNDSEWQKISVPHVMRIEEKHDGGGIVYQGVGWYRRYFKLPNVYKNKRITIHFEGVQMNCEIFLNGKNIKENFGGYMGFVVDITNKIKFESDNILALKVTNLDNSLTPPGKPMTGLDFNYYGGIYRNVNLLVTEKLYISDPLEVDKVARGGLLITFPEVNEKKSTVYVQTHVVNEYAKAQNTKLTTSIVDKHQHVVAKVVTAKIIDGDSSAAFQQELVVKNAKLWHPDHPYLYQLVSEVYKSGQLVDRKTTPIGVRSIAFKSPSGKIDGFYLNGQKLYLRGANRHQAYQYVGDAASNSMQYRDAVELKQGGFNAVRAAHYPASPAFLNACDELGLLVIECQPGWQFYNKDAVFIQRTFRDARKMVRRDRNRPSVFLWEASLNESPTPKEWMKQAVQVVHEEMPGDQMFTADDLNERSKDFYDVFYKVINPDGTDPFPTKPSLTREWGDAWWADVSKENGLRASRKYTEKGMINQAIKRQNALNGTIDEKEGGYWDHAGLDANSRIGGYFLWSFNDYSRGMDVVTAFSGVVDKDRYPKFGYYQMKSMQDARNPVYGPMVFIASYNNRKDIDTSIIVFSNCDKVRLYRNNHLIREINRKDNGRTAPFVYAKNGSPLYKFHLEDYEEGILKAEGILDDKVVCTQTVITPGKPDHLEIEMADYGMAPIADGSDMFPVYIKVCDKNGTVVSNKKGFEHFAIELQVKGEGWLIGGNVPRSGVKLQDTEGGIAYALIRTTGKAGTIVINANSQNIESAQKTIKSVPYIGECVPDGKHFDWINEYKKSSSVSVNSERNSQANEENKIDLSKADITFSKEKAYQKLTDGDISSVWMADSNEFPFVLLVDLKENYILQSYKILWGKDSDWYTHSIEVSADKKNWTALKNDVITSGQDYAQHKIDMPKTVRYFRLRISGIRPETSKVGIREVQLFGLPTSRDK